MRWLLVLILLPLMSFAQDRSLTYGIYQPHYTNIRAMGMGGAFTAAVDDYNAVFWNPAALGRLQEAELNFGLQAGLGPDILTLKSDIDNANSQTPDSAKNTALINAIAKNYGKNYWLRFPHLSTFWARPNWELAFIPVDLSTDIGLHQQVGPQLNVEAYQDSTLAFGYGKNVNERMAIGATAKAVYRGHVGKAIAATELAVNSKFFEPKDAEEGLTFDFDLGVLYNPYWQWELFKPTVGMTVRNIIDYGFKQNMHLLNSQSAEPPTLGRRVDLGTMWELPTFWVFSPRLAVDMRDMGHRYWTFKKGLHIGGELLWKAFSWLKGAYRVGLNQGYLSAGITAQFVWFKLDLAYWGEELGTSEAPVRNDRVALRASLDF